jgi:hypothetical protein
MNVQVRRAVGIPAFAAALAALSACAPDVPASPTYTKDVQPILAAHCVRCHGAGGTLNGDPMIKPAMATPTICYLNSYDNNPVDCTSDPCQHGAAYCATSLLIKTYITYPADSALRMPPSPSDPLNDWEKEVLTRWGNEKPPAP